MWYGSAFSGLLKKGAEKNSSIPTIFKLLALPQDANNRDLTYFLGATVYFFGSELLCLSRFAREQNARR